MILTRSSQRHEVQPDVCCRRLGLQVPLAVSVKNGAMAEVFETICSIAMNPYVPPPSPTPRVLTGVVQLLSEQLSLLHHRACPCNSNSALPGGADRALSAAARVRMYVPFCTLVGGAGAGLLLVYRTFGRPGSFGSGWVGQWLSWFFGGGRREL